MAFWSKRKKTQKQEIEQIPISDMEQRLEQNKQQVKPVREEEQNQQQEEPVPVVKEEKKNLEQEEISPVDKADQKNYIRDCCESIAENERQIRKIKKEYEQVTEYLTDIQKIDRITGENREIMLELCKKIKHLLQERNQYKNRELTITDGQIRRFDMYQDELIDEIKKMYQTEAYQRAIESDMMHLEEEKAYLRQNQREIVEKQNALKGMSKILAALIISLIVLFVVIYYTMRVDMTYPYIGTLLLAAVSATVIFVEANRNRRDMTLTERKMNKAIGLLNRTKIKYINNVSVLDYDRHKFKVKNAADFENFWGEYCKAKEYERIFRENTEQLNRNNEELLDLLTEYQVADPEVWLIQTYAILDKREMVEIRHELNQRRQKLREQVEYNITTKKNLLARIERLIRNNPEQREDLLKVVREFNEGFNRKMENDA